MKKYHSLIYCFDFNKYYCLRFNDNKSNEYFNKFNIIKNNDLGSVKKMIQFVAYCGSNKEFEGTMSI